MEIHEINYLRPFMIALFEELGYTASNTNVLESFIIQRVKKIKEDFPHQDNDLMLSAGYIRDLTKFDGGNNLFPTGYDYNLTTNNLKEESQRLMSYACCLSIAQGYEVLESYLKNVLASLCVENNLYKVFKIDESSNTFLSVRDKIRYLQEKNNKGLLKLLRTVSESYKHYEKHNIQGFKLDEWLDLISTVRHAIVHNRQIASEELLKLLASESMKRIFYRYFELRELKLGLTIFITSGNNRDLNYLYQEFAYLIYKTLSKDFDLPGSINWEMYSRETTIK